MATREQVLMTAGEKQMEKLSHTEYWLNHWNKTGILTYIIVLSLELQVASVSPSKARILSARTLSCSFSGEAWSNPHFLWNMVSVPCRTSQMSLRLVVAVTRRRRPSVRPVRCSAARESVFTRSGGVMETLTARTAVMKPTVVCTDQLTIHTQHFKTH